jgi:hypothetical protein
MIVEHHNPRCLQMRGQFDRSLLPIFLFSQGNAAQARYTQSSGNPRHGNVIELARAGKKII